MKESGENYLETILLLKREKGYVRSIDIANALGFSKPSISRAVGILKSSGYIVVEPDGSIEFTPQGLAMAEDVYDRHRTIAHFLMDTLGIGQELAEEDACRIEHIISQETFDGMKAFVKKTRS